MSTKKINTRRQTERALLGTALVHPEILNANGFPPLLPEDFGCNGHRTIWRAVQGLLVESRPVTPDAVSAEMEHAGCADLAELGGIATEPDLHSALAALAREADPSSAIDHGNIVRAIADNGRLAEQLGDLADQAKAWPPLARSFFCNAFSELVDWFCGPAYAGAV